jgi:hypothetical protein
MVEMAGSAPCYSKQPRRCLSASPRCPGQDATRRLLQPTYDTCTRRVFDFRVPGFRLGEPPPRLAATSASAILAKVAPVYLAANQPRMDARLTPRLELRPRSLTALCHFWRRCRAPLRAMLPLPQRYRPWAGLATSASDALCRASRPSGNPNACEEPEPASTDRASTRPAFPVQSAFHRQVLPRNRSRGCVFVETRHRSRGFATYGSASDVFSLP